MGSHACTKIADESEFFIQKGIFFFIIHGGKMRLNDRIRWLSHFRVDIDVIKSDEMCILPGIGSDYRVKFARILYVTYR